MRLKRGVENIRYGNESLTDAFTAPAKESQNKQTRGSDVSINTRLIAIMIL